MGSRGNGATAIPKLFTQTVAAFRALLRAESRMLVREASAFASAKARSVATLIGAAVLAFIALVFFALAAAAGLANVVPAWAAALIVAAGLLLIGALLAYLGIRGLKKKFTAPREAADRIKEDLRWATNKASR
jgi:protein-S-isoprenylcysteine O-methyltransferase Ste14